jgi:hypothetical protein
MFDLIGWSSDFAIIVLFFAQDMMHGLPRIIPIAQVQKRHLKTAQYGRHGREWNAPWEGRNSSGGGGGGGYGGGYGAGYSGGHGGRGGGGRGRRN